MFGAPFPGWDVALVKGELMPPKMRTMSSLGNVPRPAPCSRTGPATGDSRSPMESAFGSFLWTAAP